MERDRRPSFLQFEADQKQKPWEADQKQKPWEADRKQVEETVLHKMQKHVLPSQVLGNCHISIASHPLRESKWWMILLCPPEFFPVISSQNLKWFGQGLRFKRKILIDFPIPIYSPFSCKWIYPSLIGYGAVVVGHHSWKPTFIIFL